MITALRVASFFMGEEGAAGEVIDERLVDLRPLELEVGEVLRQRQLGDGDLGQVVTIGHYVSSWSATAVTCPKAPRASNRHRDWFVLAKIYEGRCIRPSNQPTPMATIAVGPTCLQFGQVI
jgi:hypothetical protein